MEPESSSSPKKKLKLTLMQFIKFSVVGVSNTIISTVIYYLFLLIDPRLYLIGSIVGWILSVFNGFYWNHRLVFNDTQTSWLRLLLRTYVAYGGSFLIGNLLLVLQVSTLGISAWLAPWISMVLTVPLNFALNKFWAFRN